jgi:hypothetical protein
MSLGGSAVPGSADAGADSTSFRRYLPNRALTGPSRGMAARWQAVRCAILAPFPRTARGAPTDAPVTRAGPAAARAGRPAGSSCRLEAW